MRPYYIILRETIDHHPRRIDFRADGPDHAFQIARNEADGVHVELWEGAKLLARMTKSGANMWKLLPTAGLPPANSGTPAVSHMPTAGS